MRSSATAGPSRSGDLEAAAHAFGEAAEGLARLEFFPWSAFARLGLARSLAGLGRSAEAEAAARAARQIFERIGATPSITECDALLGTLAV